MDKHIIVEVAPDGSITIDSQGFKGAECEKATKFLEESLGVVASNKRKPEYAASPERKQTRSQ
jgi:hypothetical protein